MTVGPKFKNVSPDPDHAHLGCSIIPRIILDMAYLCTKFEDSTFIHSKDINKDPKHKNRGDFTPKI